MAGWSIGCLGGADGKDCGKRALERRVAERKSAHTGLVGNDPLAADQKLLGEIAGDEAQEPGRQAH
jgi:hypothetical protein